MGPSWLFDWASPASGLVCGPLQVVKQAVREASRPYCSSLFRDVTLPDRTPGDKGLTSTDVPPENDLSARTQPSVSTLTGDAHRRTLTPSRGQAKRAIARSTIPAAHRARGRTASSASSSSRSASRLAHSDRNPRPSARATPTNARAATTAAPGATTPSDEEVSPSEA